MFLQCPLLGHSLHYGGVKEATQATLHPWSQADRDANRCAACLISCPQVAICFYVSIIENL